MTRAALIVVALLAASVSAAVTAPSAHALIDFVTPKRAAYCGTTHGPGFPYLMCWTPNDGFTVTMSARGRPSKSYGKPGYHDPYPGFMLRFGETHTMVRTYTCTSRRTGVTCTNRAGHGWWLGRFRGYRLF